MATARPRRSQVERRFGSTQAACAADLSRPANLAFLQKASIYPVDAASRSDEDDAAGPYEYQVGAKNGEVHAWGGSEARVCSTVGAAQFHGKLLRTSTSSSARSRHGHRGLESGRVCPVTAAYALRFRERQFTRASGNLSMCSARRMPLAVLTGNNVCKRRTIAPIKVSRLHQSTERSAFGKPLGHNIMA